jgi:COP9 signalosome complex subunit 4
LGTKLLDLKNVDCKELCSHALAAIAPRANIFNREEAVFRRELAEVLDATKDTDGAIKLLIGITYDANEDDQVEKKVEDYLRLAEMYHDKEDSTQAEVYVNRVAHIIYKVDKRETQLRYNLASTKCADSKREFVRAAQGYYNLSTEQGIDAEVAPQMYHKSLVCTILSPAGPRKDRMLALLVNDDRAKLNPHYNLLQKMATGGLIKREFAKAFEDALEVHQKVKFSDGYTVLDKALIEHNITVLSRIYTNITFSELGIFLGISATQGEKIISKMISERRVHAVLDQLHELVEF